MQDDAIASGFNYADAFLAHCVKPVPARREQPLKADDAGMLRARATEIVDDLHAIGFDGIDLSRSEAILAGAEKARTGRKPASAKRRAVGGTKAPAHHKTAHRAYEPEKPAKDHPRGGKR